MNYLKQLFTIWYSTETASKAKLKKYTDKLDYQKLSKDINSSKFGQYVLTGKKGKLTSIKLGDEWNGKTLEQIAEYLTKTYGKLPDLSNMEDFFSDPSKHTLDNDNDWSCHFFFGSLFRGASGDWNVPYSYWHGGKFSPVGRWLGSGWDADYRVVIFADSPIAPSVSLDPLNLDLRLKTLEARFEKLKIL